VQVAAGECMIVHRQFDVLDFDPRKVLEFEIGLELK
jgi:hypothetical protein